MALPPPLNLNISTFNIYAWPEKLSALQKSKSSVKKQTKVMRDSKAESYMLNHFLTKLYWKLPLPVQEVFAGFDLQ